MEHVRIDEGIKRGPRKKTSDRWKRIKSRDSVGQALAVIPADLLPAQVLDRYLSDERIADIAASYGVKRSRLNQWLLEHAEEHWRKAQIARAITLKEEAQEELASAADPLTLGRARERLRSAQWDLERVFNRVYGQHIHQTIDITSDLGDRLRRADERVIEGQSVVTNVVTQDSDPPIADTDQ